MKERAQLNVTCLVFMVVLWILASFLYNREMNKARVCNKGFQLYLYYNQGVKINLDKFYEDAVKWVDDPQYQVDGIK